MKTTYAFSVSLALAAVLGIAVAAGVASASVRSDPGQPVTITATVNPPTTSTATTATTTTATQPGVSASPVISLSNAKGRWVNTVKAGTKVTFWARIINPSTHFAYTVQVDTAPKSGATGQIVASSVQRTIAKPSVLGSFAWKAKRGSYIVCASAVQIGGDGVGNNCKPLTVR